MGTSSFPELLFVLVQVVWSPTERWHKASFGCARESNIEAQTILSVDWSANWRQIATILLSLMRILFETPNLD